MKADTVSGWLNGRHFPERFAFIEFCRTYEIKSDAARDLLYGPERKRDRRRLQRATANQRLLNNFYAALDEVECRVVEIGPIEMGQLVQRLEALFARLDRAG